MRIETIKLWCVNIPQDNCQQALDQNELKLITDSRALSVTCQTFRLQCLNLRLRFCHCSNV